VTEAPFTEHDLYAVVSALLDEIDPETLEAVALTKLEGLDGGMRTGEAFLSTIKEMILGGR
jgi:hypothetical protein